MSERSSPSHLAPCLKKAGLSDKSARVYAALAELGNATPSVIAKHAGVNRSTAYKLLLELSIKGVVSELQRGKKLSYQIESPRKLVRFAEQKTKQWQEHVESAKELLPRLEALVSLSPGKPKVRFYQGPEGIKDIYTDHVTQTETYEMLGMSNTAELRKMLPATFLRDYVKTKAKLGIKSRGILPDTSPDRRYKTSVYAIVAEKYQPKFRYIPANNFPFQGEVTLYGKNSVSFINFSPQGMAGVIIEDDVIASMLRLLFELAWKGSL